ncbi:hypothetical protein [Suttonella indologenes]|nr:hypothetical protein [Suttonella indologenes]
MEYPTRHSQAMAKILHVFGRRARCRHGSGNRLGKS